MTSALAPRSADFLLADISLDDTAKSVPAEFKSARGQLLLNFGERFHSSSSEPPLNRIRYLMS